MRLIENTENWVTATGIAASRVASESARTDESDPSAFDRRPDRRRGDETTALSESTTELSEPSNADGTTEDVDVLVGVPAYDEEFAIGSTVLAAKEYGDRVVVVDDGSEDSTASIADKAGAVVLPHGTNRGKGAAVRTLLDYARTVECRVLVLLDGDGQHDPADIPALSEPVLNSAADLVIGNRYADPSRRTETPRYRRFGQRILDLLTTTSSGVSVSDSQSGFRALSPTAIDDLTLTTDGMSVETEMITDAAERDLEVVERSIDVRYEGLDTSSYNPVYHGLTVATFVAGLIRSKHSLVLLGVPGLLLTVVGVRSGPDSILTSRTTSGANGRRLSFTRPSTRLSLAGFATLVGAVTFAVAVALGGSADAVGANDEPRHRNGESAESEDA